MNSNFLGFLLFNSSSTCHLILDKPRLAGLAGDLVRVQVVELSIVCCEKLHDYILIPSSHLYSTDLGA